MVDLKVQTSLFRLSTFRPNHRAIDYYGRCEGDHNVSRNGFTIIGCSISVPDQDVNSKTGRLTYSLDIAAALCYVVGGDHIILLLHSLESARSNGSVREASPIGFSLRHAIKTRP